MQVGSDQDLASLVRKGSAGLQELEQMAQGSRVPAVALARSSMGAASSPKKG